MCAIIIERCRSSQYQLGFVLVSNIMYNNAYHQKVIVYKCGFIQNVYRTVCAQLKVITLKISGFLLSLRVDILEFKCGQNVQIPPVSGMMFYRGQSIIFQDLQ